MSQSLGHEISLTEHELSEIRMLIHERTGISFDESRERFFSTRVREYMQAKGHKRGTELLRSMRKATPDYQALLKHYDPRGKFRNEFLNTNIYGV